MTMRSRVVGLLAATAGALVFLAAPAGAAPPQNLEGGTGPNPNPFGVPICIGGTAGIGITMGGQVPGQETCESVAADVADIAGDDND